MTETLRVLLIEDSEDDAQLILRELRRGEFELQWERVETAEALREALARSAWDIIMCDYSLPQFTALDALEILRESGLDIPILIISGTIGEESAVTALKSGAHDFLIKGNLARLIPAVKREISDAEVRRQHREAQIALEKSEERFRSWIEYSSDLVTVAGLDGIIQYESHSSEHLLGYAPEELVGKSLFDLVHPEDRSSLDRLLAPGGDGSNGTLSAEFRLLHKDGTWHDFEGIRRVYVEGEGQASIIINSRDITERKQRERELEAIASVTVALRAADNLDELLTDLLDETISLIDAVAGNIWLYDEPTGQIREAVQRGLPANNSLPLRADSGIAGLVIKEGEPVVVHEFHTDPRVLEAKQKLFPEGIGGACIPLRTSETIVGGIFIFVPLPREIATGELRVLNALAEIGGSSIHRSILFEQTVKQVQRLGALRSIDLAISGSFDLRLSLNTVLEQILKQLEVDAAAVLLLDAQTQILSYAFGKGFRKHEIDGTRLRLGEGYAGRAAMERETIFVEDLRALDKSFAREHLVRGEGFISYFAIPLIAKGRVEGILEVFHRAPLNPSLEWREFLEALAGQAAIAIDNLSLFQGLQQSNYELAIAYDATIEGWSHALDLRDRETEGHTLRVTDMSIRLCRSMKFSDEELVHIRRGAVLHDIGKMGVPDNILHKPGPLTEEEWEIMRRHPQYAYEMLSPITYLRRALDIPYAHHERWDGSGYPRGLKGEMIPLSARIFAIVDVWDALTSHRPYRPAWPEERALHYIQEQSGSHFDPAVVQAFLREIEGGPRH